MLFSSFLNGVSTLATSDTNWSIPNRQQPSGIPANAGLKRPSGRKAYPNPPRSCSGTSLAEVGLVLGPRRASTTGQGRTAPAANESITPGASTGSEGPRSCHGHHPPRRGRRAHAGRRVEGPSAAAGQQTPRTWTWGPRRMPAAAAMPGAQAEAPRAPGLPRPAPALLHQASSRPGRPRSPYPPG